MSILNRDKMVYLDSSLSVDNRRPVVAEVWCSDVSDLPTATEFTGYNLCTGSKAFLADGTKYGFDGTDWVLQDQSPFSNVYTKTEVDSLLTPITDDITSLDGRVDEVETTNSYQYEYIYQSICYSELNYLDYKLSNNLFDKDNVQIYSSNLYNADSWVYASSATCIRIPCNPSTTYCVSIGAAGTVFRVSETSSNLLPSAAVSVPATRKVNGTSQTTYTFTTAADTKYILFQGAQSDINNWFETFMLNYGDTALSYVPYSKTSVRNGATTAGNGYICQDLPINLPAGNYVWKMKRDGNTTTTISVKDASNNVLYTTTRGAGVNDITQKFTISADAAKISIYAGYSINYSDNMIFKDLSTSNRSLRLLKQTNEEDAGQSDREEEVDR